MTLTNPTAHMFSAIPSAANRAFLRTDEVDENYLILTEKQINCKYQGN